MFRWRRQELTDRPVGAENRCPVPTFAIAYLDSDQVLGIHPAGVDFAAFDKRPVHIFLIILGPAGADDSYVQILARASRFLRDKHEEIIASASEPQAVYDLTLEY